MPGPTPMKVSIRGRVFASVSDAAKHFGVRTSTIYHALSDGREDYIGLGQGKRKKGDYSQRGGYPAKPLKLGAYTFRSIGEAERQLGFSEKYLSKLLRKNTDRAWSTIYAALLRYEAAKLPKRSHHNDL